MAPFNPANGAGSSLNAKTLVEAQDLFRQGLFLEDVITIEEFSEVIITNVRLEDFQQLAELNNISKAGSKDELAKRILEDEAIDRNNGRGYLLMVPSGR